MHTLDIEAHNATLIRRLTIDAKAINLAELLGGVVQECLLVGQHTLPIEGAKELNSLGEADGVDIVGRARLELQGQVGVGGLLKCNLLHHIAAAQEWGHCLQPLAFAIEHAHTIGAVELMAREGVEVAIQLPHIDLAMDKALAAVHHNNSTHAVGPFDDGLQVGHRTEGVARLGDGHNLGPRIDGPLQTLKDECALVVEGDNPQAGTLALAHHLPRHNVGVVLHLCDDHIVALVEETLRVAIGHRVERRRGTRREDNLPLVGGAQSLGHHPACILIECCAALREVVYAAVDVGVLRAIQLRHPLDDTPGLLGRGAIVEIDQRLTIDLLLQDGELPAYIFRIKHSSELRIENYSIVSFWAASARSSSSSM